MKRIVTIGGGNGQSNLLDAMQRYFVKGKYHISSIVSMSDDGRTTGELMRKFRDELGLHLPPPGDLRRCLFMMSGSKKRDEFQQYLETVIERDIAISELTVWDYFKLVGADKKFREHLEYILVHSHTTPLPNPLLPGEGTGVASSPLAGDKGETERSDNFEVEARQNGERCLAEERQSFLNFTLPLPASIKGHKVGNILMGNLYYNLGKDYHEMLKLMHRLLEVEADIIPVTTQRAYIKAVLGNGEVIETQDRISNVASYSAGIADLQLMEDSKHAYQHKDVFKAIKKADYIVIAPGDLFTSTISNFVVGGVKEVIQKTDAKIIYICNSTNKGGETQGLTCLDFINKIERFLGRRLDYFISNNKKLDLTDVEKERFKNNISVKGGDYLYLSEGEKDELTRRKIQYIEADVLDRESMYKHDKKKVIKVLESVL